jgi:ribosomal protein S27E
MRRQYCLIVLLDQQTLLNHTTAVLSHCAVCSTQLVKPYDCSTVSLSCLLYRPCWVTRLQFCLIVLTAQQTLLSHMPAVLSHCSDCSTDLVEPYDRRTVSLCSLLYRHGWVIRLQYCLLCRTCWAIWPQYCLIVLSALQTSLSHTTAALSHCAVCSTDLVEPYGRRTVSLCC